MSFNKVILIGNLTKDTELRYTPQGTPVCTLRLAVNSKYKQGNEMKEETLFIDAVVFGKQAESCNKYLNKGSQALVEGRLRERRWEKDGQQRSKFEVVAQSVRFLSSRRGEGEGAAAAGDGDLGEHDTTDLEPF